MNSSALQKRRRIRQAPELYAELRRVILERDGWRCQKCGSFRNLDVHHMRRRSALGDDTETNLITLCRECHQLLHESARWEISRNCNAPL
jgi:5-methylcytosine-specific restriction endonuclease McrA